MKQEARQEYRMGIVVSGLAIPYQFCVAAVFSGSRKRQRKRNRDRGLWALYTRLTFGDFTL